MSSSEVHPPRPRRRWRWLVILLILLAAVYCVGWFVVAGRVDDGVARALSRLAERGVAANCNDRTVDGFPLSLGVTCSGVTYDDPARNISFTTGALDGRAMVYNPLRARTELQSPLRVEGPDFPPLLFGWDKLSTDVGIARPVPSQIVFAATGLSAETDPDDETNPIAIFDAVKVDGVLTPDGQNLVWNGSFEGLQIDPGVIDGRALPPLNGLADATIVNGVTLITDRPRSLRGQSFEIRNLALSAGAARLALSGPVSIDQDGLIDADLSIKLTDPAAISTVLQQAIPEQASQIRTGFTGLAFLGKEPTIPFKIAKGRPQFMGFSLGAIRPLQ